MAPKRYPTWQHTEECEALEIEESWAWGGQSEEQNWPKWFEDKGRYSKTNRVERKPVTEQMD